MTRIVSLATVLGVALFALDGQARAGSESFTANFGPAQTEFMIGSGSQIPQFNPALGTLTSVVLTMSDGATMSGTLTNSSNSPQTFKFTEMVELTLTSTTDPNIDLDNTVSATKTYTGLAAGATATFAPPDPTGSIGPQTLISGLDPYVGTGVVALTLSTLTSQMIAGGGGNITASLATTAEGMVTVTYNYTAVPEPASIAMMGMGLVGLVAVRRFRRARSNVA